MAVASSRFAPRVRRGPLPFPSLRGGATRRLVAALLLAAALAPTSRSAAEPATRPSATPIAEPAAAASRRDADAAAARSFLETIRPDPALQSFLDGAVADLGRADATLARSGLRVAVIDLAPGQAPGLAAVRGADPVYPASVVKFVYLMAALRWQRDGLLTIDAALDRALVEMIRVSSNKATQAVVARVTGAEPGPELAGAAYDQWRERRLSIKRWLVSMGIDDLHAVSPTYDGDGDLAGRDRQFLRDREVAGGLAARGGEFPNRQAMTATGTARLLALLATDRGLAPADAAEARRRMRRDVREQPHLARRIAGGVAARSDAEVYSKSGTWGPIYADAGIVRHASGRQFVLAVFTDASPPWRGDAIAGLSRRLADHLFGPPASGRAPRPDPDHEGAFP